MSDSFLLLSILPRFLLHAIIAIMGTYRETAEKQRRFFLSGSTLSYDFRKAMLLRLKDAMKKRESEILSALHEDLGKSEFEGYATELGVTYEEINYLLKNLRKLMRKKKVHTPITQFRASSYIIREPMGSTLIMSPWNYPLMLTLVPLAAAIAGGNTVIVKPSRYSRATSAVMKRMIDETFGEEYIALFEGGRETNEALLELRYDMIFFTGSPSVGRLVHSKCTEHLTPCILELGGKSPVIVDGSADISLAARRIAWGKFLNAGQTCVAPDYLLIQKGLEEKFIEAFRKEIGKMFGPDPLLSDDFPKIINERHFERVNSLIAGSKAAIGGSSDREKMKIEPTLLYPVFPEDPVMQEEIFGPVLPLLTFSSLDEAVEFVREREKPLALYIFSSDRKNIDKVLSSVSFGGGCVNDTVVHLTAPELPFGGVGNSGMGSYHGSKGFEAFTHGKSIMNKAAWMDLPVRYAPFGGKIKLLRMLMK